MSELDFEELDKAVNSLMGQAQTSDEPADNQSTADNTPVYELNFASNDSTPQVSDTQTDKAPSSPTIRRSPGRFMDVVPPSSASRGISSKAVQQPAVRSNVRDSGLLQPISTPEEVVTETPTVTEPEQSLDVENNSTQADGAASTPMQSPFLTDIEVDKRPLGGLGDALELDTEVGNLGQESDLDATFSQTETQSSEGIQVTSKPIDDVETTVSGDTWVTESDERVSPDTVVIPPEMDPEVMALESAGDTGTMVDARESVTTPVAETSQPESRPANQPSTPGDIVPQYTPGVADSPEPSAIFEVASEVPEQLNHPERKKSGWSVVLWIFILILIGIGAGIGAWFFLA